MSKRGGYFILIGLLAIIAVTYVYFQVHRFSAGPANGAISDLRITRLDTETKGEPPAMKSYEVTFTIPNFEAERPALLFNQLKAQNVRIYIKDRLVYESFRSYPYNTNNFLISLHKEELGSTVTVWMQSMNGRAGPNRDVEYGEESVLQKQIDQNMQSFIIGSAFILIAFVMLCCTLFLRKTRTTGVWLVLTAIICLAGILFITYSSYMFGQHGDYGPVFFAGFDLALFTFLPTLTYFFERIVGKGYRNFVKTFRIVQVGYSLLCAVLMVTDILVSYRLFPVYYFFSVTALGFMMIAQFVVLTIHSITYAMKGNRDAAIFAWGTSLLAMAIVVDLLCYYITSGKYELILWKWGITLFVITLLIIMGRKLAEYYEQIVNYSREVELYNNRLQRSEKLEIVSELAASIAHEVRNPLQVTRGFLQLLLMKVSDQEKEYMNLAISELDRAAGIITDFLTFAKPQLDQVEPMHVESLLKQIEGIIIPLARLNGGEIELQIARDLYIRGNSSKFKQAVINIIKNSIEAFRELGHIRIWAYEKEGRVRIHIRDNGEGMNAEEVARLGEPYFSTKTKGTGLGLMVTFRIIEVMEGDIKFVSEKGKGTEVIMSFPSAVPS
ncbi:sensor histidine kinase [Gordoniibacillus kamchatkensis]|uniref:sensor histidine kinase n=1 Tax=Gordoniibacillus kamchatkensis TaxID=1590651 RepID=UPI0006968548|nr:sensor histidine kinase [Paenibacillus sp. VKM B-2647]